MNDEAQFAWYTALRFGEVISEGPTPIPDEVREEATEIRWSKGIPEEPAEPPAEPEPEPEPEPDPEP